MNNLILENPLFLSLIIFYILCIFIFKETLKEVMFPNLEILEKLNKKQISIEKIIMFVIINLLAIGISSPIKTKKIIEKNKGFEISLIFDTSGSMKEGNKFKIAKKFTMDFIEKRKNDKIALTVFSDFSYVAIPLTYDNKIVKELFDKVEIGITGFSKTSLNEAIFLSSKLFETSKSKNKIAILITDGKDNVNAVPIDVSIKMAKKYNIKIYTIGIGNEYNYDSEILKRISNETNGKYYSAQYTQDFENIYNDINMLEKSKIENKVYIQNIYYYQYILFIVLFLLFIFIILKYKGMKYV